MWKSAIAFAVICGTCGLVEAASLKSFSLKCVNRQEVSNDDIYLAAQRDGQPVPWGADHQPGMSTGKSLNMSDGGILTLDAASLSECKFNDKLQIDIKEKDVTADELIGTVNIMPDDGVKHVVFKTEEFEYHVDYEVVK